MIDDDWSYGTRVEGIQAALDDMRACGDLEAFLWVHRNLPGEHTDNEACFCEPIPIYLAGGIKSAEDIDAEIEALEVLN